MEQEKNGSEKASLDARARQMTPQEKYTTDQQYRLLVDTLMSMIERAQFTPSELREAVLFAAIRHEQHRIKPRSMILPRDGDDEWKI